MDRRPLAGLILVALACTPAEPPPPPAPPEVVYAASEFMFDGPDSLAPGMTHIRFENHGTQPHHMILGKLDEGKTLADLQAAMQANPNAEPGFMTWRGAAGAIPPQESTGSTVDLAPGHYLLMCFVPDPADQTPHIMKGMVKEIVVAGEANGAAAPTADGEIHTSDFAFTVGDITAGTHTFHFINDGPSTHEIQLVRLNEGATMQDLMAAFGPDASGPPPVTDMGGPGALSNGGDNYWTVTLTSGHYVLVCFVPDSAGVPHVMKGMVKEFTIPAS